MRKKKGGSDELNTYFSSLPFQWCEDVSKGLWAKAIQSQSTRIDQIVEIISGLRVFNGNLNTLLIPAFEFWSSLNCSRNPKN